MAISDVYTARSGSVAVAATTATAVMSVYGTAAKRGNIVGIRMEVGVTAAAVGNDIQFTLARCTGTNTGTSLASVLAGAGHDYSAPASVLQYCTTWSTAPTLVAAQILGEWTLPQTTGSMWEEFPPSGYEWQVQAVANAGANAGVHVFCTPSVATSTPVFIDLIWSE